MTMPPVIRIFFAIDLPDDLKEKIGNYILELKRSAKTHSIRWTKPENLHVTLQFLPDVQTQDLTKLLDLVFNKIANQKFCANIDFGEVKLFPNPFHPRVIVLDVLPQESLQKLSEQVGEGIMPLNYEPDARPFNAHLTLGRIKHPKSINLDFLKTHMPPDDCQFDLREICLFRSEPLPEGSRYTILERILVNKTL